MLDASIDIIRGDSLESSCKALRPDGKSSSLSCAPDEAQVERRGRGVFHCRRHARPARQDLSERGTLNLPVRELLDPADASIARRMLDGSPHKTGKIVLNLADWPRGPPIKKNRVM